jgi:predicted DNA-binding antitoxin AbrB/MazE fold protein
MERTRFISYTSCITKMAVEARIKRWGNSFGIVIPAEEMKEQGFKEGEEVIVDIRKKKTMGELFGSLKGWDVNAQDVKDELRRGWKTKERK